MRTKLVVMGLGVGLFLAGAQTAIQAHHAFAAEFDEKKPIKFSGLSIRSEPFFRAKIGTGTSLHYGKARHYRGAVGR